MDKDHVIAKLREHEAELRAAGILSIPLFGSVARGDASDQSDVDLIAEFDRSKKLSLLGAGGFEIKLTDILGVKTELAQREMLKPDVLKRARARLFLSSLRAASKSDQSRISANCVDGRSRILEIHPTPSARSSRVRGNL